MRRKRNLTFTDFIDLERWQAIQDDLAQATRMEIHLLSPTGEDLCPPSGMSRFRQLLGRSPRARERIRQARTALVQEAARVGKCFVTTGSTGRLKFALPIVVNGSHLATVTGGGVLEAPYTEEQIRALAEEFHLDEAELQAAAAELEVVSREAVQAAGDLMALLLNRLIEAEQRREEIRRRAEQVERLYEVGKVLTATLDWHKTLEAVAESVLAVLDVTSAFVTLIDEETQELYIVAARGISEQTVREARFARGTGLVGYVAATGEPVLVADMRQDPRNAYHYIDERENLRAMVAVPLRRKDRIIGVIAACDAIPHTFTEEDANLLSTFAAQAAIAVENARLYDEMRQAYRDLAAAHRALRAAQEKVLHSARLATLGQLASGTVHELKNVLGGIIGAASTLRDRYHELPPEAVRELTDIIAAEGWRLRQAIEEMRDYAKPQPYQTATVPLPEIISEAQRLLQLDKRFRQVRLQVRAEAEPVVTCDREKLKQVFINLLLNALEAVDPQTGCIEVWVSATDTEALVEVRDNGCGIPADKLDRIWEPFYTTKGETGTGLGLDLVRQIVTAHRGTIEVESEVGKGTTFTLRLPLSKPLGSQREGQEASACERQRSG